MEYTVLHRLLNRALGPVDDELLSQAIEARLEETDDLDWKRQLPERKGLGDAESEYLKDVAAFANGRGGVIVYGVSEKNRAAIGRTEPCRARWCAPLEVETLGALRKVGRVGSDRGGAR